VHFYIYFQDESDVNSVQEGSRGVRSFSIFSWLSSLAAKFKRDSQGHDRFLDSSSSSDSRDRIIYDSSERKRPHSPTQTYTLDPNCGDVGNEEPAHVDVDSVFGSRQDVDSVSQPVTPFETGRLSSLELLKPLKRMEEEGNIVASGDQPTGATEVGFEQSTTVNEQSLFVGQSSSIIEQAAPTNEESASAIEKSSSEERSTLNRGIEQRICSVPVETKTEDLSKHVMEEKSSGTEGQSTKLHRRTPSTFSRTQMSTAESQKRLLRVPRTMDARKSSRPK